jgi:predicted secreted hydrolase
MLNFAFFFLLFSFCIPAGAQDDFAKVDKPWQWKFPRDHGKHSAYQSEWWYFTGNLQAENGRRFGYELTFFRQALSPSALSRPSRWAFRDAYVAHFAITDVTKERFYYDQQMMRGALRLAGADSNALDVHLGSWFAAADDVMANGQSAGGNPIHLRAAAEFGRIELQLRSVKPPIFHGDRGLLPNSDVPGDAAYYYSFTSLHTAGTLFMANDSFRVLGVSWMDHEFFTGHPGSEVKGWDWFSLHLSDSTEVMLFYFHRADGSHSPFSAGTFIHRNGDKLNLTVRDFKLTPQDWWTSPVSGGKYPVEWKIKLLDYDLQLRTPVKNQELDTRRTTGVIYWEGVVEVNGKKGERAIHGEGYLEMTGYAK